MADGRTLSSIGRYQQGSPMLINDSLRSADSRYDATARRRLLRMAADRATRH